MAYADLTLKKLFALSGNECAFPGCDLPVIDTEHWVLIGQICHIKGRSPAGPRYDENQTDAERDGYENLLVMCASHNKIVDDEQTRDQFPVERLAQIKKEHESRARNTIVKEDVVQRLVNVMMAMQPGKTAPVVVPLIESYRTSADNVGGIDYYCFRVSLRNDGEKTIHNFRLEIGIPNAYADPTHQGSMRENVRRVRGVVTIYRHTQEQFPGFVLYPNDVSDLLMNTNYQMRFKQYRDASGFIRVSVYSDDDLSSSVEYSIRDHRNKDRMVQLGIDPVD